MDLTEEQDLGDGRVHLYPHFTEGQDLLRVNMF